MTVDAIIERRGGYAQKTKPLRRGVLARPEKIRPWEAYEFRGAYSPIIRDGDGQPTPESYKMIRVERTDKTAHKPVVAPTENLCQACGRQFGSKKELDTHIDTEHLEAMADKDEADKRREKRNGTGKTERLLVGKTRRS